MGAVDPQTDEQIHWRELSAAELEGQAAASRKASVVWLTGRSGAGKSTIAGILEAELRRHNHCVGALDGDDLRAGLCDDLGFSRADRDENVRRAAEVARLMAQAGLIVVVSLISPFRDGRAAARGLFEPDEFFEVYVDTPLEVAERRDPKGLYRLAREGELCQFTSIDSPYEPPDCPELRLDTVAWSAPQCAAMVIDALTLAGRLDP